MKLSTNDSSYSPYEQNIIRNQCFLLFLAIYVTQKFAHMLEGKREEERKQGWG
jgi:hypothetical protein